MFKMWINGLLKLSLQVLVVLRDKNSNIYVFQSMSNMISIIRNLVEVLNF
jgi:hypothetical protein